MTHLADDQDKTHEPVERYVPPYPARPEIKPSVLELIKLARRSLLSIWTLPSFSKPWTKITVLRRMLFICNSPATVQEAFVRKHVIYERKSPQMRHALEPLIGDGLFVSDGETWRRRRQIVAPIIHASRVPAFFPVMAETVAERRAAWEARGADAQVDMLEEMAHLTAEIICRTIFGRQLGRDYAAEIVESFTDYQRHIDQVDILSLLRLPDWIPRLRGRAIKRAVKRIDAVLEEIISSYQVRAGDGEASVIGGLLDARDEDGRPLSREAIRNEAAVIFMAGHETTANTLAWTWFLLSQAPWARNALHAELDAVCPDRDPAFEDIARLPYARAVIEETLRLYPPVPILAREANRDDKIAGVAIPKGSIVMVVPWLLHRNPNLWERADHFEPERFLGSARGGQSKFGYVPFAIGPRICAGLSFGMTESVLSLAMLARSFDPGLEPGTDIQPVSRLTLRPGERLPMRLRARDG
ncbi:cytochrome P450 [Stappia sp. ES.058]|uniref:cytochrome P450 n=1 Tax=Stappia sp. ES.058 TaxID=1881061 RepID=UPI00087CEE6D|nr:cytochrome P450 [Stappia sp. ES.058]SDU44139.1 Cytochrome P450 [Stappia sp. ES.058]